MHELVDYLGGGRHPVLERERELLDGVVEVAQPDADAGRTRPRQIDTDPDELREAVRVVRVPGVGLDELLDAGRVRRREAGEANAVLDLAPDELGLVAHPERAEVGVEDPALVRLRRPVDRRVEGVLAPPERMRVAAGALVLLDDEDGLPEPRVETRPRTARRDLRRRRRRRSYRGARRQASPLR